MKTSYSMIELLELDTEKIADYKFISLEDKHIFTRAFQTNFPSISEYTFTNLYMWRYSYCFYWKQISDSFIFLVSFKQIGKFIKPIIFPPILLKARDLISGDEILKIRNEFFQEYIKLKSVFKIDPELNRFDDDSISILFDISDDKIQQIKELNKEFDEQKGQNQLPVIEDSSEVIKIPSVKSVIDLDFSVLTDRNNWDYVYTREQLLNLPGKSFLSIRRKINKFKKEHNWSFKILDEEQVQHCLALQEHWCNMRDCDDNEALTKEHSAILDILNHKESLDYTGIVLYSDDKIVAFCIGEKLNPTTYVCHVEKADSEVFGAYQVINRLFAEHIASDAKYLNREQDLGEEGLRISKMRYKPNKFIHKYVLKLEK